MDVRNNINRCPRRLESVGDKMLATDRGLWALSDPWLSSPARMRKKCCYSQKNFGSIQQSVSVSNSSLTHNQHHPFKNKVRERYFYKEVCSFVYWSRHYVWLCYSYICISICMQHTEHTEKSVQQKGGNHRLFSGLEYKRGRPHVLVTEERTTTSALLKACSWKNDGFPGSPCHMTQMNSWRGRVLQTRETTPFSLPTRPTAECLICTKKHVLVKKIFTNRLNVCSPLHAWKERLVHGVEIQWLSGKEKVPGAAVRKEGHPDSNLGHKRNHQYWHH